METIAENIQTITHQHSTGEVRAAESLEAARGMCPVLGQMSIEEAGLLLELEAMGAEQVAQPDMAAEEQLVERPVKSPKPELPTIFAEPIETPTSKPAEVLTNEIATDNRLLIEVPPPPETMLNESLIEPPPGDRPSALTDVTAPDVITEIDTPPPMAAPKPAQVERLPIETKSSEPIVPPERPPERPPEPIMIGEPSPTQAAAINLPPEAPASAPMKTFERLVPAEQARPLEDDLIVKVQAPSIDIESSQNDDSQSSSHESDILIEARLAIEPTPSGSLFLQPEPAVEVAELEPEAYYIKAPMPEEQLPEIDKPDDEPALIQLPAEAQPYPVLELPAPAEQINSAINRLAESLEPAEQDESHEVHRLVKEIIALPLRVETSQAADPADIEERLEELFTELLEALAIEPAPELVRSLAVLTKLNYLDEFLATASDDQETFSLPDEVGAREFLQKIHHGLSKMKRTALQFYMLGRSALRLHDYQKLAEYG